MRHTDHLSTIASKILKTNNFFRRRAQCSAIYCYFGMICIGIYMYTYIYMKIILIAYHFHGVFQSRKVLSTFSTTLYMPGL